LLYTRRSEQVYDHKGQVSFPGGACEPEDASIEETALREAKEEIGVEPADVQILGRLPEMRTVSFYNITPVVGVMPWPTRSNCTSKRSAGCSPFQLTGWPMQSTGKERVEPRYMNHNDHLLPVVRRGIIVGDQRPDYSDLDEDTGLIISRPACANHVSGRNISRSLIR
jgi:hypothetical protein